MVIEVVPTPAPVMVSVLPEITAATKDESGCVVMLYGAVPPELLQC